MNMTLTPITATELAERLLAGERDFQGIRLHPDNHGSTTLNHYTEELAEYLKRQDLKRYPVNVSGSDLQELAGFHLYLPHLKAIQVNLRGAHFEGSNFEGADFRSANLSEAFLGGVNLHKGRFDRADISRARLYSSNLSEARFKYANIEGTDFTGTNIMGANDLEQAYGLESTIFIETRVGEGQREFVERVRRIYDPRMLKLYKVDSPPKRILDRIKGFFNEELIGVVPDIQAQYQQKEEKRRKMSELLEGREMFIFG